MASEAEGAQESEEDFYHWSRCGHESSSPGEGLPEKIQLKGHWLDSEKDKFDLAWYTREDINRRDHNLLVQTLALVLSDNGYRVGWQKDLYRSDAIALIIELPQGQIDYSIPLSEKIVDLPEYEGEWLKQTGGTNIAVKHEYLIEFVRSLQASPVLEPFEG